MDFTTMALRRRPACCLLLALLSVRLAAGHVNLGPGDVAVFWGRNRDEGTLREACDTGSYSTVIISFLVAFGHGTYRLDLSGHPLYSVGSDIKHCKNNGIRVLLSIGGQGGEYSLPSSQAAADVADYLWDAFLGGFRPGVHRPFGNAVVDGVDFFIDQGATEHYDELACRLYAYGNHNRGREVMLTATPRCGYPDQRLAAALATGLFNRIHVRLYGEGIRSVGSPRETWEKWAKQYPGSRMFVGVVASPEADAAAYLSQEDVYNGVLQFAQKLPNYGGLMIWNRYYDRKADYMIGF